MSRWAEFAVGLVVVPVVVVAAVTVWQARRIRKPVPPGSREARRIGCACPRVRNWWGLREAVCGRCDVALGCPVLAHRPERRRAHGWLDT